MRFEVLFLVLLGTFAGKAQEISGIILSKDNQKPVESATVQLFDKNKKTIDYTVSNNEGKFVLALNNKGTFIKITSMGFVTQEKELTTISETLIIYLEPKTESLKEVVIDGSAYKEFQAKRDSIIYNLAKLRDSTEVNLEDIIKKLPGLEINADGRISYQNQEIDNVLIEGNEFFGKNHKMATKNIPANAVSGVELLKNYQGFGSIKDVDSQGKIVLNIKLNENYKGRIVGNVAGNYGIKNRYLTHGNLFNFFKKGNIAFVSDFNNIGERAITVNDYIEIRGGISSFINIDKSGASISTIDESEFPKFVLPNDNVDTKTTNFSSFNYTHQFTNKFKFTGYSLLNYSKVSEFQFSEKDFFENSSLNSKEKFNENSNNFLSTTFLNLIYKPNKKISLDYKLTYNPTKDVTHQFITNLAAESNSFKNKYTNKARSFGQTLDLLKAFNSKWSYKSNLTQNYLKTIINQDIISNQNFLGFVEYQINQNQQQKENLINWKNGIVYKRNKRISYKFKLGYLYQKNTFLSNLLQEVNGFETNEIRKLRTLKTAIDFNYKIDRNFNFKFSIAGNSYQVEQNNIFNKIYKFLPSLSLRYKFLKYHELTLNYGKDNQFIGIKDLIRNNYIENYQKIISTSNLKLRTPIDGEKFGLDYFLMNTHTNLIIGSSLNYTLQKNALGVNTEIVDNYIIENPIRSDENSLLSGVLNLRKSFTKIPYSVNFTWYLNKNNQINTISKNKNEVVTTQNITKFQLDSKFKTKLFQFSFGGQYNFTSINQTVSKNISINTRKFFTEFRGNYTDNLLWKLNLEYLKQSTTSLQNSFFKINPTLQYSFNNDRFQINLKGNNILNLDNNTILTQTINQAYVNTSNSAYLRGYLLLGIRYNF
jgi:hypothetical protein